MAFKFSPGCCCGNGEADVCTRYKLLYGSQFINDCLVSKHDELLGNVIGIPGAWRRVTRVDWSKAQNPTYMSGLFVPATIFTTISRDSYFTSNSPSSSMYAAELPANPNYIENIPLYAHSSSCGTTYPPSSKIETLEPIYDTTYDITTYGEFCSLGEYYIPVLVNALLKINSVTQELVDVTEWDNTALTGQRYALHVSGKYEFQFKNNCNLQSYFNYIIDNIGSTSYLDSESKKLINIYVTYPAFTARLYKDRVFLFHRGVPGSNISVVYPAGPVPTSFIPSYGNNYISYARTYWPDGNMQYDNEIAFNKNKVVYFYNCGNGMLNGDLFYDFTNPLPTSVNFDYYVANEFENTRIFPEDDKYHYFENTKNYIYNEYNQVYIDNKAFCSGIYNVGSQQVDEILNQETMQCDAIYGLAGLCISNVPLSN